MTPNERHWTAGSKIPPADFVPHESDWREWPHDHLAIRRRHDLEDEDRLARMGEQAIVVICAAAASGGIVGVLITWLVMR